MKLISILPLLFFFVFTSELYASTTQSKQWSHFRPYVPEKRDYSFELGSMWEDNNLYRMGAQVGFHLGRCVFSFSYTCQQYLDLIGGVGGREGLTMGATFLSLRWQFASIPTYFSPSISLLAGLMNIRDNVRDRTVGTGGIGYGVTTSLHERLDLKWEMRAGYSDQIWGQTFVSFVLKMDKWVDHFAERLKRLGEDTVDKSGQVIKKTLDFATD